MSYSFTFREDGMIEYNRNIISSKVFNDIMKLIPDKPSIMYSDSMQEVPELEETFEEDIETKVRQYMRMEMKISKNFMESEMPYKPEEIFKQIKEPEENKYVRFKNLKI